MCNTAEAPPTIDVARHEAAHAVFAWYSSCPYIVVTLGRIPGTDWLGGLDFDLHAAGIAARLLHGNQAGTHGLLARLAATAHIAELADVQLNGIASDLAALRAGKPILGHEIGGDFAMLREVVRRLGYQPDFATSLEDPGKQYAQGYLNQGWFRDLIQAVAARLMNERIMTDARVAEIIDQAWPAGMANIVRPEPSEDEVRTEAFAFYSIHRTDGRDLADWYSAKKGLRFRAVCQG